MKLFNPAGKVPTPGPPEALCAVNILNLDRDHVIVDDREKSGADPFAGKRGRSGSERSPDCATVGRAEFELQVGE